MGREQKRRDAKKNRRKIENNNINLEDEIKMSTTVKTVMSVLLILVALYYVLAIFVTKEIEISNGSDKNKDTEEVDNNQDSGVSNKILGSATFRQSEEVYYVYYYDFDDENDMVSSAISGISDNEVYRVDTGDSLNSNYVTDENGNRDVTDISGLKVKNPTLIKIDNDKVVSYYEGKDEIVNALNK